MTDTLLGLVPAWGPWLVAAITFLSCIALPVPSSLVMLAAGGFTATGDLSLPQVGAAALSGAVLGDQAGFALGRRGGAAVMARVEHSAAGAAGIARARALLGSWGDAAVFFTRWLFSAAGPWINLAAGAAGHGWRRFTLWGTLGETVWVGAYIGLGRLFAGNLQAAGDLMSSVLGILAGAAAMLGFGFWLLSTIRHPRG